MLAFVAWSLLKWLIRAIFSEFNGLPRDLSANYRRSQIRKKSDSGQKLSPQKRLGKQLYGSLIGDNDNKNVDCQWSISFPLLPMISILESVQWNEMTVEQFSFVQPVFQLDFWQTIKLAGLSIPPRSVGDTVKLCHLLHIACYILLMMDTWQRTIIE